MTAFCFGDPNMVRKPRPNDWTKEEKDRLRQLAKSGLSQPEAASVLGKSHFALRAMAHRLNIRWGDGPGAWTSKEVGLLRKYARMYTQEQAAELLGRGLPAVRTKASDLHISFRKYGESSPAAKLSTAQIADIFERHDTGALPSEIAKEVGVTTRTIYQIVNFESRYSESLPLVGAGPK